jgi:hypothetical protein
MMTSAGLFARVPACRRCAFPIIVVLLGAAVVIQAGCPDPCVVGGGCNTSADSATGEVCRVPREHELGCFVVRGTCLADDSKRAATLCGSVDDCAADECCDPRWNRCVRADLFTGPNCDAATCHDCAAADLRAECSGRNDCPAGQICDGALDEEPGLCAAICSTNADCAPGQRCDIDHCTVGIGAPCIADDERDALVGVGAVPQQDRCHGLTCATLDVAGNHVDPYCTGNCILQDDTCPADFVCSDNQCNLQ